MVTQEEGRQNVPEGEDVGERPQQSDREEWLLAAALLLLLLLLLSERVVAGPSRVCADVFTSLLTVPI